jgi:hypothetical protein
MSRNHVPRGRRVSARNCAGQFGGISKLIGTATPIDHSRGDRVERTGLVTQTTFMEGVIKSGYPCTNSKIR